MADTPLLAKLSWLDRLLSLWIALAAGLGLGLGQLHGTQSFIDSTTLGGGTNVLVAIGLIVMMYPPLAKVRWNVVHRVLADWRLLLLTTIQNWVLGPFAMYLLAAAFFHSDPGYMAGLSLVGCARCIAMVVVWNALAGGDDEYCAAIVAINSIITIALYSPYAALFLNELPTQMSLKSYDIKVSLGEVAKNVGIYMGVPFVLGIATWYFVGRVWKGEKWYRTKFTPRIGTLTLIALLFTVVVLFATQSERITDNFGKVLYSAVPLLIYFLVMFVVSFVMSTALGATYAQSVTLAFTAASNNFELALAVAIASFGLKSDPALMSVVGALIEIPTMLALVHLAFWFKTHLKFRQPPTDVGIQESLVSDALEDDSSVAKVEHKQTYHHVDAAYIGVDDA
ncbi:hypothetical protein PINS_up008750 [Pythium insidiosum]|nr:hypothetical protein PINS_up008750 [Pythium insidiosum]